jgi:hypothetical protein
LVAILVEGGEYVNRVVKFMFNIHQIFGNSKQKPAYFKDGLERAVAEDLPQKV